MVILPIDRCFRLRVACSRHVLIYHHRGQFAKAVFHLQFLAAAAFVLLCYNPYFLWDVGFQLSFLAVVSIVVFQRPVYHCWYIKNKWLDQIWKLAAISLAAQVLTFPICIYYFHQFPNFFLLANIVAVPLSSLVLYAEIGLIAFSRVPFVGYWLGKLVGLLVKIMNEFVLWINRLPYAVWDGIAATECGTGCFMQSYLLPVAGCCKKAMDVESSPLFYWYVFYVADLVSLAVG